ncbi:hypothetical protein [Nocardia asiatica]|uniref:hypothetical protein n=1 Tax=Nocardia asiatica TaxID=209252 RepID=UPI002455B45E|nr:hypothetical protein [Nocardia asiatica]
MTVRIGPRDLWAVQWLSEMRGVPMDVVADLLGTSEPNAYRVALRWKDAGLVIAESLRPVPGSQWVVPTATTATSLLGFTVQSWIPGPKEAKHLTLTARVRLALAGNEPGVEDTWVSERVLRRSDAQRPIGFGGERPHLHDGHWTDDLGRLHAIEVELTRKGSADIRRTVAAAFAAAKTAGAHDLIYYCGTDEIAARVKKAAEAVLRPSASDPGFVVRPLDGLLNPKPETGRGRLAAAGGAA